MGICAVADCLSSTEKVCEKRISFHTFPRTYNLLKLWVDFCRRKDQFNPRNVRICSLHFEKTDFDNFLKFETGFANRRILKQGAVPTLRARAEENSPDVDGTEAVRYQQLIKEERELIINDLLDPNFSYDNASTDRVEETKVEILDTVEGTETNCIDTTRKRKPTIDLEEELAELKKKVSKLEEQNFILSNCNDQKRQLLNALRKKLTKSEHERMTVENSLKVFFTPNQIRKLKNDRRIKWTQEDIVKSLALYLASSHVYKILRTKGYPLPGIRTLQNWTANNNKNKTKLLDF